MKNAKNADVTFSSSSTCNRWERAPSTCSTQSSNATNPSPRFKMFKCSNVQNVQMFKILKCSQCSKCYQVLSHVQNWKYISSRKLHQEQKNLHHDIAYCLSHHIAYYRSSTTTSSTATCGSKSLVTSPAFTLADPASYF